MPVVTLVAVVSLASPTVCPSRWPSVWFGLLLYFGPKVMVKSTNHVSGRAGRGSNFSRRPAGGKVRKVRMFEKLNGE